MSDYYTPTVEFELLEAAAEHEYEQEQNDDEHLRETS